MKIEVPPEIAAYGITLLPATDASVIKHAERIAGIDLAVVRNVLTFSVVLVNNGQNRILQTTVGFEFQDEKDQPHREIFNLTAFNRGLPGQIPQGGARLIVPQRGLNVHFAGTEGGNVNAESIRAYSDVIAKIETAFGQAKNLSAFIDSVTIEGVGLVGPDLVGVRGHGQDRKTMY